MSGSLTNRRSSANPRIRRRSPTYSRILAMRACTTYRSTNDAFLAQSLLEIEDLHLEHRDQIEIKPRSPRLESNPCRSRPFEDQTPSRQHSMGQQRWRLVQHDDVHVRPMERRFQIRPQLQTVLEHLAGPQAPVHQDCNIDVAVVAPSTGRDRPENVSGLYFATPGHCSRYGALEG